MKVPLINEDGNAFAIMARVSNALREAGVPNAEVARYIKEATSADYNHLLMTTLKWVTVK